MRWGEVRLTQATEGVQGEEDEDCEGHQGVHHLHIEAELGRKSNFG